MIQEDVLRGIEAALLRHDPRLAAVIQGLLEGDSADGSGTPDTRMITAAVPRELGEQVLWVLTMVERRLGSDVLFDGLPLGHLVCEWDRFTAAPPLPPQP